ncbi:MAG: hypothetical protein RL748_553, partial [Pseudomonadota bacterium]
VSNPSPLHHPRIDFLRGIAILCVLLLHFALAFGLKNSPLGTIFPPAWLRVVFSGNYGVTMFFVISGYLITTHSLARWGSLSQIKLRDFYLLRLARIMPALLLALSIIVILGSFDLPFFNNRDGDHQWGASYFWLGAGSVLTFWHNVLMQSSGYFNYCLNIYWSLSVEEVFYLALPLAALLLRRTAWLVLLCLGALVLGPVYRFHHSDNEIFFMYAYQACFDAIAMGVLTALLAHHWQIEVAHARALRLLRYGALLALAVVYCRGIDGHEAGGFSLIALASSIFIFSAVKDNQAGLGNGHASAWLRWFGRHSYELYLFHIVVLALLRNLTSKEQLSYAARLPLLLLFLALSALLAALVARYVSGPANAALRRRWQLH